MRIESALYTSGSALLAHGNALAVVGNNIANSSTIAFRSSRTEFADMLADGSSGRQSSSVQSAGNGSRVQQVREIPVSGEIEATGRPLDFAIEGSGFFQLQRGTDTFYTRAGNFEINEDGILVNNEGFSVMGYAPGSSTLSTINLLNPDVAVQPTSLVDIDGNLGAQSTITTLPTNPQTFNEISRSASAIASVSVVDSLGESHPISIAYFKTDVGQWTAQAYIDGGQVGGTAGVPVQLGNNATLSFSSLGVIPTEDRAAAIITAAPAYNNGAAAGAFRIDLGGFSQYSTNSTLSLASITQNGIGAGEINGYTVTSVGEIIASFDSGLQASVGTLALSKFRNEDGLIKIGNNIYEAGETVGVVTTSAPTTEGLGSVQNGGLERSNVDLATAFVELVLLQRGYQANSQMLEAVNQMVEKAYSLIR